MRGAIAVAALLLFGGANSTYAAAIKFDSDPFAGSTALTDPGRQIVGGEIQRDFDIAADVFVFDPDFFAVSDIQFVNDEIGNIPSSGVNTIVLRTFDNDNDPLTPFGAGSAATLIANQITTPGAGFFVYFNSGLNLPRLVYSTDLDSPEADLKVLFRILNLSGNPGALALFTANNFAVQQIPEPATMVLMMIGATWTARRFTHRRSG
jgi:hypothetical protein